MEKIHWSELPDEKLVFAAILGELRAFDELVLRYRAAVVWTALGIVKSKEAAEDVAQEALLLAFKALPDLNDMNRFPAWLYAITRRRALRYRKQSQKRQQRHLPLDEMILRHSPALRAPPPPDEPDDIKLEVRAAVERLPEDFGTVVKLHYYDEMPLKRIAELGKNLQALAQQMEKDSLDAATIKRLSSEMKELGKQQVELIHQHALIREQQT